MIAAICVEARGTEIAFSRIIHGWGNYSTAFSTTHDSSANGEFATAATFYTPPYAVKALEFSAILIWSETPPQVVDFSAFTFAVCFWTSLDAFISNPAQGDVATVSFAKPTRIAVDTFTRGGRPAYDARFVLTNASVTLTSCQTYLIGLIARTDTSREGELYVPTAGTEGASDVQAGNIVPFGWQYLINAGGLTIYDGQLASELIVERFGEAPRLLIARTNSTVNLSWQTSASCYQLEMTDALGDPWVSVTNEPEVGPVWQTISVPYTNRFNFFRLAR